MVAPLAFSHMLPDFIKYKYNHTFRDHPELTSSAAGLWNKETVSLYAAQRAERRLSYSQASSLPRPSAPIAAPLLIHRFRTTITNVVKFLEET